MRKCGACGKFLSSNDLVCCTKCSISFHRACIVNPPSSKESPAWCCDTCKPDTSKEVHEIPTGEEFVDTVEDIDIGMEIRSFRIELGAMRTELKELRADMVDFKRSIESCNNRVLGLEERVGNLEKRFEETKVTQQDTLQNTIADLKQQLNDREQESLLNDIEIAGVPESQGESPMHVLSILTTKLGLHIDERDVMFVKRTGMLRRNRVESVSAGSAAGGVQRHRTIAVLFTRRTVRDSVLSAARVCRDLTVGDLELQGTASKATTRAHRVYINERLTRVNRQLFSILKAREAGSRLKWRYIWTKDGRILARKDEGQAAALIRVEADINRIFGIS